MLAFVIKKCALVIFIAPIIFSLESCTDHPKQPLAKINNVVSTHHGIQVDDPYRWLEDWDNSAVKTWSESQNSYARHYLNSLPNIEAIRTRISEIKQSSSVKYYSLSWKAGKLFAIKYQPPLNQPFLVAMPSVSQPEKEYEIINPNKIDSTSSIAIDWYIPSPNGKLVAVSLSEGGSEEGNVHIYQTENGKQIDVVIPRVNGGTAGGDLAWLPDGSGFYYTRYPYSGERDKADMNFFQQVWFHKMGTPLSQDHYELGKDFPRIAENRIQIDPLTSKVMITMQNGDSGKFLYFLGGPGRKWKKLADYEDKIVEAVIGQQSKLYMISKKDAPKGKVLVTSLKKPSVKRAELIIPESVFNIVSSFYDKTKFAVMKSRLFVTYQTGGPSEIRAFDLKGNPVASPETALISSINELAPTADGLLFLTSSYVKPPAWYFFNENDNSTRRTKLFQISPADFSDTEVIREFTTSKDGTRIPINIIYKKGLERNHQNPVLLYGYGGYNISRTPRFKAENRIWIEQGCVYAVANIRGGGEYGEKWHHEGRLTKKQNCFDDFAAMKYMIDAGFTSKELLAINGGSNGGLLMGAMITQHPELFRATVSTVGVYDMIRSELTPNGTFNIPEYGTIKVKEQFEALYGYSPYHNAKDETAFPSILFMTGANDPRVDPMHSRKMTARLQAANRSDNPILLRTSSNTGHGRGTPLNAVIEENTHKFVFLFHELGMKYKL